jgi:hypothetical protein
MDIARAVQALASFAGPAAVAGAKVYGGHAKGEIAGEETRLQREEKQRAQTLQDRLDEQSAAKGALQQQETELNMKYLQSRIGHEDAQAERLRNPAPKVLKGDGGREFPDTEEGRAEFDAWDRAHNPSKYRTPREPADPNVPSPTQQRASRRSQALTRIGNMAAAGAPPEQIHDAMGTYHELAGAWTPDDVVAAARKPAPQPADPRKADRAAVRKATGKTPVTAFERNIEDALVGGKTVDDIVAEINQSPTMKPEEKRAAVARVRMYTAGALGRLGR